MIKLIIGLVTTFTFFYSPLVNNSDLFQIYFKSHNKGIINMSAYSGKQILIAVVNASTSDNQFLKSLDTLSRSRKGQLVVIAIPVMDYGINLTKTDMILKLTDSLLLSYVIADTSYSKSNLHTVHPLINWLTKKELNKHFDGEIKQDGEIFIINSSGVLYAKLNKRISPTGIKMQRILDNIPITN